MKKAFLKAAWRKLLMVNYAVEPQVLLKYLPQGTELDLWEGKCFVSLVGFMFLNTELKGLKIPFHQNFEEVNLRFYVTREEDGEWRRGVVFVKEIVPKFAITLVANTFYKEKYETLKTAHEWLEKDNLLSVKYAFRKNKWFDFKIKTEKNTYEIVAGSEEEFITEHYWGYTKINDSKTGEYGVEHPKWNIYKTLDYEINIDFKEVYGSDFAFLSQQQPNSVFLAEGSEIIVRVGSIISDFSNK